MAARTSARDRDVVEAQRLGDLKVLQALGGQQDGASPFDQQHAGRRRATAGKYQSISANKYQQYACVYCIEQLDTPIFCLPARRT